MLSKNIVPESRIYLFVGKCMEIFLKGIDHSDLIISMSVSTLRLVEIHLKFFS